MYVYSCRGPAMETNGNANGSLSRYITIPGQDTVKISLCIQRVDIYLLYLLQSVSLPYMTPHSQQSMKGVIIPGKEKAGREVDRSRERWASDSVGTGRTWHAGNICSCWHKRAVREHVIWLTCRIAARMGPKPRGECVCVCVCLPEPRREQEGGRDRERGKTWVNESTI